MSTIVIPIRRKNILMEVRNLIAYIGAKRVTAEDDAHDRIRTVKEDKGMLEKFLFQSLESLKTALHPYYKDLTGNYDLLLEMPMNFDEIHKENLKQLVESYLEEDISSAWLAVVGEKDDADKHATDSAAIMDVIIQTINKRKRPIPPIYDEEHNIIQRQFRPQQ